MIMVAVVEDDDKSAELIDGYVRKFSEANGIALAVKRFKNGVDFISDYSPSFDIVLMDIEMPLMDGMEAARKLRELGDKSPLIFITNVAQYAVRGYEVGALDFMVKPVSYFNFTVKLKKAIDVVAAQRNNFVAFVQKDGVKKIYIDDLLYVEVFKHRLFYHTASETFEVRGSMKEAEEQLGPRDFAKCNSCWLVNLKYVTEIRQNFVWLGEEKLQISRNKRKEFLAAVVRYFARGGQA